MGTAEKVSVRSLLRVAEAEKEVIVLAVWHTSQHPDRLQKRLG
ncbi:MAG: hypothetical protein AVDCRST_MAG56-585 [uncultured Cytophagales bacterium]|uniref:Uncharacterized protein n=1 Tax=uncultured Cytophagales bacterium TaxID=158755 RepID=A0A6J4HI53_9SPHI|nr:MAG: hypothetical protein AVDCRST_MAG56-585 [uncultured Cytophagales bacterium]